MAAVRQASCAKNIVKLLQDRPTVPADFKDMGLLAAFGHGDAVAESFGIRVTGWPAWFMWRTIYLMKMPGLGRKIRVALDWTLDLLVRRDFVELAFAAPRPADTAKDEAEVDAPCREAVAA